MKLKIPFRDDKFKCKVFHKSGDQIFINGDEPSDQLENVMVKGARVRCIIRCVGLWCTSNFMCQWELQRCEIEVPDTNTVCSFLPDSDEEDVETSGPRVLDDSDDDQADNGDNGNSTDDEPYEAPPSPKTPTPEPEPVKRAPPAAPKKIRKKKVATSAN